MPTALTTNVAIGLDVYRWFREYVESGDELAGVRHATGPEVERFIEEVLRQTSVCDLSPVLERAYDRCFAR